MKTKREVTIVGCKGGVGASTITAGLAAVYARNGLDVAVTGSHVDLDAILGDMGEIFGCGKDVTIHDGGDARGVVVSVVECSYIGIKRQLVSGIEPDVVVAVIREGASLDALSVEQCLGVKPIVVEWCRNVARAVDAGLLVARMPKKFDESMVELVDAVAKFDGGL